ncbi:histidine kinase [Paenibacillus alvei TS-15]|jgi:signal transduction histidine kinase|uniref:histidine kinase n=1 Tax=Paenibacillus alvei TS-15 TaxID=1117108 RepID=S9U687_PAEAL|nr:histidine kinase [Paenibacillus alvei TS-15]
MMITGLLSICMVILLIVVYTQRVNHSRRNQQLTEIQKKLEQIHRTQSAEKLLLFTDDKQIIGVIEQINELLVDHEKALANYAKTEIAMRKMISNISHDLKTPLTVVLGYLETLNLSNERISDEERNRLLTRVHGKTVEVIELIHTFFDLAKLESGDKHVELTRVDMSELCRKNILQFYERLTKRGFEVDIQIPEASLYARGNEDALDRMLNNLISNAIEYGADSRVLGIALRSDDTHLFVDVWDRGKGIPEQHQDRVFERMYTLEDSRNKNYEGSGLGLTITKRLAESMGGSIELHSKPFKKTIFTIKLLRMS